LPDNRNVCDHRNHFDDRNVCDHRNPLDDRTSERDGDGARFLLNGISCPRAR
jgi:hypothetical protein